MTVSKNCLQQRTEYFTTVQQELPVTENCVFYDSEQELPVTENCVFYNSEQELPVTEN
jgi:hypothetical protein